MQGRLTWKRELSFACGGSCHSLGDCGSSEDARPAAEGLPEFGAADGPASCCVPDAKAKGEAAATSAAADTVDAGAAPTGASRGTAAASLAVD